MALAGSPPESPFLTEAARSTRSARFQNGAPVELIPGLACVGVFAALATAGGGYALTSWGPAALFMLGLLLVVAVVGRERLREIPTASRVALAFLAAFVAWNFLSISWAEVQGVAWDGANRTLLYLIAYATFSILIWRPSSAWIVMGSYAVVLAAVGTFSLLDAIGSADPDAALIGGRFAEPANYPNAVAALFIGGFWPAMFIAGRRETPWLLRGLLLATAGLLVQLALLPQSRGSLIVMPLALLIYLAVVPNRLRALIFLVIVALATTLAAPAIVDVFSVSEAGGDTGAALSAAGDSMLASFIALFVVGLALGFADSRVGISEHVGRLAGRVTAIALAAVALLAAVVAIATVGNPVTWAGDRLDDFKGGYSAEGFDSSRFSGDLGSNRYDFWRVAIEDQFGNAPLIGEGSDNFAVTYLRNRESGEEPLYPHSLPIRILGGTGIIGLLLFSGFLISAIVAAGRSRRVALSEAGRAVPTLALAAAAYLVLHSSGDWLWSFPAITAPVFAWLGIASQPALERAVEATPNTPAVANSDGRRPAIAVAVGAAVLVLAFSAISLTLPWLAARDVQVASANWRGSPDVAIERLDRARGLNFLSAQPDLTAGAIASQQGDRERVRESFTRALEREPTNWYALLELGVVDGLEGRRADALATLARARSLNPGDPLIREASRRITAGNPMTLREIDDSLLARVCTVVGRTDETRYCDQ